MKKIILAIVILIAITSGYLYYKNNKKNIFFVGNSITAYGLSPDIGWHGNWGMAASSESNDYVHKTVSKLNSPKFQVVNLGDFEYKYNTMDLSFFKKYKDSQPFIMVYQAGENVDPSTLEKYKYTEHLKKLIHYINPHHVVIISEFWPDPIKFQMMQTFTKENGYSYVDISKIMFMEGATAKGMYENDAVALHPSDKGMELISEELFKVLKPMF
ncbi:SGNH/GDSL hydrolase family protein [Aeromonas hydrophila]|uniref:SGNH/GDSL hydrolase family protein n=1 Tax=Aeromonas hydrophila TaxID=644 RepID=UPI002B48545C|nr:hypothetical protein [Aeromonas hydrophila]